MFPAKINFKYAFLLFALIMPGAFGAEYQCTTFNPGTKTTPLSINNTGDVIGIYEDAQHNTHGFLRNSSGAFISIDYPDATATRASGINEAGDIAGTYTDAENRSHGFVRTAAGVFASFDAPERQDISGMPLTATITVAGINNNGEVGGFISFGSQQTPLFFVRTAQGNLITGEAPAVLSAYYASVEYVRGLTDSRHFTVAYRDRFGPVNSLDVWESNGSLLSKGYSLSDISAQRVSLSNSGQALVHLQYAPPSFFFYTPDASATASYGVEDTSGSITNVVCPGTNPADVDFTAMSDDGKLVGTRDASGVIAVPTGKSGALQLSHSDWTFSAHAPGELSGLGRIYLTNAGNAPVHMVSTYVTPFQVNSSSPNQFINGNFMLAGGNCPAVLNPGATCNVGLEFYPDRVGDFTATLNIAHDGSLAPSTVHLHAVGSGTAFSVGPTKLNFGGWGIGGTTWAGIVYPYNYGNTTGAIEPLTITGDAHSDFFIDHNGCPAQLAPYTSCAISIRFRPTAPGFRAATLQVGSQSVILTGTGY